MADTFAADSVKSDRLEVEHDVTFMRETVCKLQLAAKHITRQNETICQLQAALEESEKMVELKDAFETKAKDLQRELEKAKKVVADDNQQISFLEDENHKLETQAKLFRAETNDTKLHFKENKQSLESISERYYRLESESRLLFMQGHEIERKNEKKISDLKEMLSLEQQKSEDYLEKALTHERTCGELISTVAAMKNTIDELQAKLKDIDMLETMFCELKEKYATVKLDNSSTMVDSEKVMQAKNAEIDRLNDSLEKVNLVHKVTSREFITQRGNLHARQDYPRAEDEIEEALRGPPLLKPERDLSKILPFKIPKAVRVRILFLTQGTPQRDFVDRA